MDNEYRLRNFTKEDLSNFNYVEDRAKSFPLVRDSLDYLLDVLYRFENYVVEKIIFRNKRQLKLRKNNFSDSTDLIKIVDRIEEYSDELSIDERLFISKIRNLITHIMRRLHVDGLYSKSRLRNESPALPEKVKRKKSETRKEIKSHASNKNPKESVSNAKELFIDSREEEKIEAMKHQNKFRGNALTKRRSGNLNRYINAAKIIKVMEDEFRNINGVQKKACEIAHCNDKSFSRWINASNTNNSLYHAWKNSIKDEERDTLREQINRYLKK